MQYENPMATWLLLAANATTGEISRSTLATPVQNAILEADKRVEELLGESASNTARYRLKLELCYTLLQVVALQHDITGWLGIEGDHPPENARDRDTLVLSAFIRRFWPEEGDAR